MGPSANTPFTMGPPPRPPNGQHHRDASLTLAPLQSGQATSMGIDTQAKSLEAMILSIPTLGKIKVLSKISLPLGPPSPTSPDRKTRGLVIAVDAADQPSLEQLTHTLELNLSAYGVRTFTTPKPPAQASPSFQSYLRLIDQFHTLSAQVIDHITASPDPISSPMSSPSPVSPKSFPAPKASPQTAMPIAIVPGWQVTWSDWFASHVDIKDAYSPMDHWQWGATLWRNVVGADVTVAVQAPAASEDSPRKGPAKAGDGEGGEGGVKEGRSHEKGRNGGSGSGSAVGGVEVRLDDARAVIVKGEKDGGVAEGGLRRVGFEIGEWVRGWSEREERAARRGS